MTGAVSLQAGGLLVGFVFVIYAAAFAAFHWLRQSRTNKYERDVGCGGACDFPARNDGGYRDLLVAIARAVAMTPFFALRDQPIGGLRR